MGELRDLSTKPKPSNDESASNSAESEAPQPAKEKTPEEAEKQEESTEPQQSKAGNPPPNNEKSFKLTVTSAHGNPSPENGVTMQAGQVTCSVNSPAREGIYLYKCTGWKGTGSVPASGQTTSVTFPIDSDSTIEWQWEPRNKPEKPASRWEIFKENSAWQSQLTSLILLGIVLALGLIFYYSFPHAFFLAIFAGAIGGMIHEFAQSYGKFLLPNTDAKGNQCLGTLLGIAAGAVAGLLVYEGLKSTAKVGPALAVSAIVSGLAAKGLADAPSYTTGTSKKTSGTST